MDPAKWTDLVVTLSFGASFILLIRLFFQKKILLYLYFGLAALCISIPYLLDLLQIKLAIHLFEWGRLASITIYISGLLVLIRDSKPVFARFPQYLTALPFVSFLFFPFIIDSMVIKDLINAIYQGGALVVTVLVFTVKLAHQKGRRYYIMGLGLIVAAYLSYWLYLSRSGTDAFNWISEILFSAGILIIVFKMMISNDFMLNAHSTSSQ
jgi:drug/metabolite transporter superfamily protein YnfA